MKNKIVALLLVVLGIAGSLNEAAAQDRKMPMNKKMLMDKKMGMPNKMSIDMLMSWPQSAQMAAKEMTDKYGMPQEMTETMLVWHNTGPWKKTVITKEESQHDFPKPHLDVMQQTINYRVSPDRYDEIAQYDGSVTIDRTQGTLSARCDKEANNFLALNLAYDIIKGDKTVEEARKAYGDIVREVMQGKKPVYTQKLLFSNDKSAPDPDMKTIGMIDNK
jgi:hypothetical protein